MGGNEASGRAAATVHVLLVTRWNRYLEWPTAAGPIEPSRLCPTIDQPSADVVVLDNLEAVGLAGPEPMAFSAMRLEWFCNRSARVEVPLIVDLRSEHRSAAVCELDNVHVGKSRCGVDSSRRHRLLGSRRNRR